MFIFISLKDKSYLYYVLHLMFLLLYTMAISSYLDSFVSVPVHLSYAIRTFSFLVVIFAFLFTSSFLNLKTEHPRLHKLFEILPAGYFTIIVLLMILFPLHISYMIGSGLGVISYATILITGIYCWKNGQNQARYFTFAWIILVFALILYMLANANIIENSPSITLLVVFGRIIEMLLLSFALSGRINTMRKQHDVLIGLQKELEVARQIQEKILPDKLPDIPQLEFAVFYRPMQKIGGDFYDFHLNSENNIGILISDVTGHGVPAALVAAMIKIIFADQKSSSEDPGLLLYNMNNAMLNKVKQTFATTAYIYFDFKQNKILYSSAGHPGLLIINKQDASIEVIQPKGKILGFMPNVEYKIQSLDLKSGNRIIMYTDGFLECRNKQDEEYGEKRFYRQLKESIPLKPEEVPRYIQENLALWNSENFEFEDDLTMIIIDVK